MSVEVPDGHVRYDDVTILSESRLALRVEIDARPLWVPKSCIHDDSDDLSPGQSGTIYLPLWWCEKERLPT